MNVQNNLSGCENLSQYLNKHPTSELMKPRMLIIDEAHDVLQNIKKPSSELEKTKNLITENVKTIIEKGRSAGICTIVSTFSPAKDMIEIPHEAGETLITGRVTEATLINNHCAGLKELVTDPRLSSPEFFTFIRGGEGFLFRVPFIEDRTKVSLFRKIFMKFIIIFSKKT
jgi:hypothetical protein